jgi:hypothetical protein
MGAKGAVVRGARSYRRLCLAVLACSFAMAAPGQASATTVDDRIAKAGVLRLSDFDPGWRQTANEDNQAQIVEAASSTSGCKSYLAMRTESRSLPHRPSAKFTKGGDAVANQVFVYPTEARAQRAIDRFGSEAVATCLRSIYPKILAKQLADTSPSVASQLAGIDVELGRQSVTPRADDTVSYSLAVTVRLKNGLQDHAYVESLTVRDGRVIVEFSIGSDAEPFPLADRVTEEVDAALARLQAVPH